MRIIRIYQAEDLYPGLHIQLSEEAGHHVGVVLRMQTQDKLVLFNGNDKEYQAVIENIHKKKVTVFIESEQIVSNESPLRITLAQAISKWDKMEWVIQKATELGVDSIMPIVTEYCPIKLDNEKLQKKVRLWESIAISACEQSERNYIPHIYQPINFELYLKEKGHPNKFILHPLQGVSFNRYTLKTGGVDVLIGPEGGFSLKEIELALKAGFSPVKMGPRILRTETAGIVSLALLQAMAGDL